MKTRVKHITIELIYRAGRSFIVVREENGPADRLDYEEVDAEDAIDNFNAVVRRVLAGAHCPDWLRGDYYDKHAELFY